MTCFYYTCCIVLLLQIVSVYATTINIALGKEATFCMKLVEPGKLTDGDKDPENSVHMVSDCSPGAELIIRLGKPYYVTYVIIHPGRHTEALENCIIHMNGPKGLEECANYPFNNIEAGRPMKINCRDHNKLFSEIIVVPFNEHIANFDIAEIEVFSLALENEKYPLLHRGCYAHMEGVAEAMSWENCQQKCFDGNYIFAAIKANSHCVCSNDLQPTELKNDYECDIPCEGHRYCGGTNAFSVYIIKPPLPYYVGCFTPIGGYWNPEDRFSAINALRYCTVNLFFLMKERRLGNCMNERPMHELNAKEYCHQSCTGDTSQACGSERGMTTFTTCRRNNSSLNCNNYTMCTHNYDYFSVCDDIGCQSGFSGEHCMHKDFTLTTTTTTTTTTTATTPITTLPTTLTSPNQEKTLVKRLRNILPLIIGGTVAFVLLLFACSGASENLSAKPSKHSVPSVHLENVELQNKIQEIG